MLREGSGAFLNQTQPQKKNSCLPHTQYLCRCCNPNTKRFTNKMQPNVFLGMLPYLLWEKKRTNRSPPQDWLQWQHEGAIDPALRGR